MEKCRKKRAPSKPILKNKSSFDFRKIPKTLLRRSQISLKLQALKFSAGKIICIAIEISSVEQRTKEF